jgi:prevent-host-death family protein
VYMHIGIRELRAGLADAVRRASAGESIVVTIGGRPVARLGPLEPTGGPTLDDLIATGAVVAPRRHRRADPETVDVPVDAQTDRALLEIR